mmetsp:Transcript_6787/g.21366  ORF Transcript_6787/g.21366 Transcript_6787/m.21366 type:complete len:216 (+) Transcript_6787:75-722(+)
MYRVRRVWELRFEGHLVSLVEPRARRVEHAAREAGRTRQRHATVVPGAAKKSVADVAPNCRAHHGDAEKARSTRWHLRPNVVSPPSLYAGPAAAPLGPERTDRSAAVAPPRVAATPRVPRGYFVPAAPPRPGTAEVGPSAAPGAREHRARREDEVLGERPREPGLLTGVIVNFHDSDPAFPRVIDDVFFQFVVVAVAQDIQASRRRGHRRREHVH